MLPLTALTRLRCFLAGGLTAANLTDRLFAIYGERVAVLCEEPLVVDRSSSNELSYGDLHRLTARCGTRLEAAGVRPGDRVAIAVPNGVEFALWCLGTMRIGAVAVPLNAVLKSCEIAGLTVRSGAAAIVLDPHGARDLAPVLAPAVRLVLADGVPVAVRLAPHAAVGAQHPCLVLYTSGTTQPPRGALHTSAGLLGRMHLALLFPSVGRQLVVMALPISHLMGLVSFLLPLIAGVPLHLLAAFDAEHVLAGLARERATMFVGVPTVYRQMAAKGLERFPLQSMRAWISASDTMPAHVMAEFKRHGGLVRFGRWSSESLFMDVYGSVEAGGAVLPGCRGRASRQGLAESRRGRCRAVGRASSTSVARASAPARPANSACARRARFAAIATTAHARSMTTGGSTQVTWPYAAGSASSGSWAVSRT